MHWKISSDSVNVEIRYWTAAALQTNPLKTWWKTTYFVQCNFSFLFLTRYTIDLLILTKIGHFYFALKCLLILPSLVTLPSYQSHTMIYSNAINNKREQMIPYSKSIVMLLKLRWLTGQTFCGVGGIDY